MKKETKNPRQRPQSPLTSSFAKQKELAALKQLFVLNALFTKGVPISGLNVKSTSWKDSDLAYSKLEFRMIPGVKIRS